MKNQTWGAERFTIQNIDGTVTLITVTGRDRWALECLIATGERGTTPIDAPGPRWSGSVHNLRALGITIETVTETHGGPFAGHHARYVLRSSVVRATGQVAA